MLSDIERLSPIFGNKMIIDIEKLIAARRSRGDLFNSQYFTNKFWDILLVLYNCEIQGHCIDAKGLSARLEIDQRMLLRYLNVLVADEIICSFESTRHDRFDLAVGNLSLTRTGSEKIRSIIQQPYGVTASETRQSI